MRFPGRGAALVALVVALIAAPLVPAPQVASARAASPAVIAGRPSAEVVGYLPYWTVDSTTDAGLPYGTLSTIVLFSVGWSTSGHLGTTAAGYRMVTSTTAKTIIDHAHAAGTRVLICFTSFGTSQNASFFSNATAQGTFISEATALVRQVGADGADLDVELISGTYFPSYASVAARLRTAIRAVTPGAWVTVATNANTSGARMARAALDAGADRAFLMGYNYRTAGANPVGSVDPYVRSDGGLSLTWSLSTYASTGVRMNRVILGLPMYGRSWQTVDGTGAKPTASPQSATPMYGSIAGMIATSHATPTHDPVERTMRLAWQDPTTKQWTQLYWDSPADTAAKTTLVLDRGLAGVGLWALGYDDWQPAWITAIATTLAPPRLIAARVPAATNSRYAPISVTVAPGARPVAGTEISRDRVHWSSPRAITTPFRWLVPAGGDGTRWVWVRVVDDAGGASRAMKVTTLLDRTRPWLTTFFTTWSASAHQARVYVTARDTGSGVAGWEVAVRRGTTGPWTIVARRSTARSLALPRLPLPYTVRGRAFDRAGNVSSVHFLTVGR